MRKVSALFLTVVMAANVDMQTVLFWDWLNGWRETPKHGMMKVVYGSNFGNLHGDYCFDTR